MATGVPLCEECGVPSYVTSEHTWLNDGSLVQTRRRKTRMAFIESENWDPIWSGIGELIGIPVERLVIGGSRRASRVYIRELLPADVRERIATGEQDIRPIIDVVLSIAALMGYGHLALEEFRFERKQDDSVTIRYGEPFSVPLAVASVIGTTEALTSRENMYEYKQVSPDTYDVRVFPSEHPLELKARMKGAEFEPSTGGIELEQCGTCGAPAALREYRWDIDRGVIEGKTTGRRMSLIGPAMIEPIFQELETELGEDIPRLVVEAQRRFVRTGPFTAAEITGNDEMRRQFALRGLGELKDLHMGKRGVRLTLAQAAIPLWVVGMVQGLYELVFGEGSTVDWELKDDGNLEIEVIPSLDQT